MRLPIRTAVLGTGFMGTLHARTLARSPLAKLAYVVDVRAEAAEAAAAATGALASNDVASVLADPKLDAVVIALPDILHVDAAVTALRAGKAVLLEKPMAHDTIGAEAIAAAAASGPGRLMVGQLCRFDPRYRQAAEITAAGEIGAPLHIAISRFCGHPGKRAVGSHLCWLMGVHDVDLIQWITGRRIARVVAARSRRDCIPGMEVGVEDVVMALLELDGGVLAQLSFGWTLPTNAAAGLQAGLRLVGTKGLIDVAETDSGMFAVTPAGASYADTRYWPTLAGQTAGSLRAEIDHFMTATHDGSPYLVPVEDAVTAVRVNDAILRALHEGGSVDVTHTTHNLSAMALS